MGAVKDRLAGILLGTAVGDALGLPMERLIEELQAAWKPVKFRVDRVSIIWRREPPDDVFRVADELSLM